MKIAVASMDGVTLSQHFGQSKGFVVFDVDGKNVQGHEFRTTEVSPHNQGVCGHEGGGAQGGVSIFDLLAGCSVVLCGGMGGGAAQAMIANGIKPVILPGARSAEDAVAAYLNGNLPATEAGFCNCEHEH